MKKYSQEWWGAMLPFITAFANGEDVRHTGKALDVALFNGAPSGYSIAPKPHNPQGVTPEQIGEGWKLMNVGEEFTEEAEEWRLSGLTWGCPPSWAGTPLRAHYASTYRTPIKPGTRSLLYEREILKARLAFVEEELHV